MKKFLCLILSFVLVASLAACGGNPNDNTETDGNGADNGLSQENKTELSGDELYNNVLNILGNPAVIDVTGSSKDPNSHVFQIVDNGVQVRYIHIDALKNSNPVNIMQVTDLHFNKLSDRDIAENNPAIADTRKYRQWARDESTVPNADRVLALADKFDAVAITGDNIDYLTWGSLDLLKEHVWNVLGSKLIMPLGGHDATRVMEGTVADPTTEESRYEILQQAWQHDVQYSNKIVGDSVMMVQMNNGDGKYTAEQAEKLAADIKYARENNMVILIFEHEPLATKDPAGAHVTSVTNAQIENFYKNCIGGSKHNDDEATANVYKLITENADVIRGIFCGHYHENYYYEIKASYQSNGKTVDATIPQVILTTNAYKNGTMMVINVQ